MNFWFHWFHSFIGLGSESPCTHLSSCVLFRYNTKLYIVVRGNSEPIPIHYVINAQPKHKLRKLMDLYSNIFLILYWSNILNYCICCRDLPPNQGGKYTGFGNTPVEIPKSNSSEFYMTSFTTVSITVHGNDIWGLTYFF